MQVLAIIGSPRKGHSCHLTQQIEQRLTKNADVRFEYVFLSQVNLEPCRGCYVCQSRGEQYCPIKDERGDLVQRMQQADGVIFVSPTYTGNVSSLMKNLMDRLAYTAHRPAFLGKPAMLVATASSYTRDTLKALSWFGYTGFDIVSKLDRQEVMLGSEQDSFARHVTQALHARSEVHKLLAMILYPRVK